MTPAGLGVQVGAQDAKGTPFMARSLSGCHVRRRQSQNHDSLRVWRRSRNGGQTIERFKK